MPTPELGAVGSTFLAIVCAHRKSCEGAAYRSRCSGHDCGIGWAMTIAVAPKKNAAAKGKGHAKGKAKKETVRKPTKKERKAAKKEILSKRTGSTPADAGTFDEAARKDWLTGFRKRKRERRLRGLAHGALKEREAKLAIRKEKRELKKARAMPQVPEEPDVKEPENVVYDDKQVMDQWGAEVTVTTTLGLDAVEEDVVKPIVNVDRAQKHAGSLEAMMKKISGTVSSKQARRAKKKRDRNAAIKVGKQLGPKSGPGKASSSAISKASSSSKGSSSRGGGGHRRK